TAATTHFGKGANSCGAAPEDEKSVGDNRVFATLFLRERVFLFLKYRKGIQMPVTARIFERKTVSVGSIRLEGGEVLPEVNVALESAGQAPESDGSNVVVVCHALTGDAHAVGDEASPGWWDGLIGPDRFIDTDQYHVITMNVPGGCDGSTGPSSVNPKT